MTLPGKFVLATTESLTTGELLSAWEKATGKRAQYVEITLGDFNRLWPMWGHEMGLMLKFWEEYKDRSWTGEEFVTKEDMGITAPLIGIEEALTTFDWSDL